MKRGESLTGHGRVHGNRIRGGGRVRAVFRFYFSKNPVAYVTARMRVSRRVAGSASGPPPHLADTGNTFSRLVLRRYVATSMIQNPRKRITNAKLLVERGVEDREGANTRVYPSGERGERAG